MTPLSTAVFRKFDGVVGWGKWLQMQFTFTMRVGTCVCLIIMEMGSVDKKKCDKINKTAKRKKNPEKVNV